MSPPPKKALHWPLVAESGPSKQMEFVHLNVRFTLETGH